MTASRKNLFNLPRPEAVSEFVSEIEDTMTVCIRLADRNVTLTFNNVELRDKMIRHFRTCLTERNYRKEAAPADIALVHANTLSRFSSESTEVALQHHKSPTRSDWSGEIGDYAVYFQTPDLLSYHSRTDGRGFVLYGRLFQNTMPEAMENAQPILASAAALSHFPTICDHLYLLLAEITGTVCLHSALVELHGKVLLLTGKSGSGKTTTALSLLRDGATLLSDEIVFLSKANGSILAEGLPIAPCLVGDASYRLQNLETSLGAQSALKTIVELNGFENRFGHCQKKKIDAILFFKPPTSIRTIAHTLSPIEDVALFHFLNNQLLGYNFSYQQGRRLLYLLELVSEAKTYTYTPGSSLSSIASFLLESI